MPNDRTLPVLTGSSGMCQSPRFCRIRDMSVSGVIPEMSAGCRMCITSMAFKAEAAAAGDAPDEDRSSTTSGAACRARCATPSHPRSDSRSSGRTEAAGQPQRIAPTPSSTRAASRTGHHACTRPRSGRRRHAPAPPRASILRSLTITTGQGMRSASSTAVGPRTNARKLNPPSSFFG